ncbi:MAG TPA: WecB/TagA/CpsF family glycosyltransferase [Verrucomicrobiae bacterium]|nr:WecB/TagA/CpsF family glycosyltransferase [Verrucomicrobiae bacterium]
MITESQHFEKIRPALAPVSILGVPLDQVTMTETLELIERMIASRRPHYIATANVDFLVQAQRDAELHRILLEANLVLCDGTPLIWASHFLGTPLPERVAGSDLIPRLISLCAKKRHRIFLLGAAPASAEKAAANLRKQFPGLEIGHYSPPFTPLLKMNHDEIMRRILEVKPDLLLVSFGCPKQEKWIAMHYRTSGIPVCIGVGGTIDFLAGQLKRAPVWMRRTGTEWIFRLAQEPRRLFKRYANDLFAFGWKFFQQWRQMRLRPRTAEALAKQLAWLESEIRNPDFEHPENSEHVDAEFPRARFTLQPVSQADGQARFRSSDFELLPRFDRSDFPIRRDSRNQSLSLLDVSHIKFLDAAGAGRLIEIQKNLRAVGRELVLVGPQKKFKRALRMMRLENYFPIAPDFTSARRISAVRASDHVIVSDSQNPILLFWQGEITAANANEIWKMTRAQLDLPDKQEMTIDLSRVRFMDSSGLAIMIRAKEFARRKGISLSFIHPQSAVQNVIHLARLDELLLPEMSDSEKTFAE